MRRSPFISTKMLSSSTTSWSPFSAGEGFLVSLDSSINQNLKLSQTNGSGQFKSFCQAFFKKRESFCRGFFQKAGVIRAYGKLLWEKRELTISFEKSFATCAWRRELCALDRTHFLKKVGQKLLNANARLIIL
jgi:hypothetical protein